MIPARKRIGDQTILRIVIQKTIKYKTTDI